MTTSLNEMLELPNLRKFESSDKILLAKSWAKIVTSKPLLC